MSIQRSVTFRIDDEQHVDLSRLSRRTGFSSSAIIRRALDRFLKTARNQRTGWAIKQLQEVLSPRQTVEEQSLKTMAATKGIGNVAIMLITGTATFPPTPTTEGEHDGGARDAGLALAVRFTPSAVP